MTTDEKLDKIIALLKPLTESKIRIPTIEDFERLRNHITDTSKKVKPTRYYPNGAYMDEPEFGSKYWYFGNDRHIWYSGYWENEEMELLFLASQNVFPTKETAEKELKHQKLIAKMYRDMRDERINGDWVADWNDDNMNKFIPSLRKGELIDLCAFEETPIRFYYRGCRFIEDLKALGWTEEELKIVWFRV